MQKAFTAILVAGLILVLTSCKKNPDIDIERFEFTNEQVSVLDNSTTISGSYSFSGNIKGITVLVAENESLTSTNSFAAKVDLVGKTFSATLDDLKPATTYYYCFSVDFGLINPYRTATKTFSTIANAPTVVILETTALDCTSYSIKCEVVTDGGLEVTERGICWSTSGNPTLNNETAQHNAGGTGQYSIRLDNLSTGTKYHVRAYARNSIGISYSDTKQFTTCTETFPPTVSSVKITDITYHSAICHGEVISNGGLPLTVRGVCWGLNPEPTINEHAIAAEGTAIGSYTVVIDDLAPCTTYYARCYATNEKGTSYGEALTFTTFSGELKVTTLDVTDITATSAKSGGRVTNEGAGVLTECGICWGTEENPTIVGSISASSSNEGVFEIVMEDLSPGTTYHVRAYATYDNETTYGEDKSFTTLVQLPTVITGDISIISATSIQIKGFVADDGGASVTERGFCLSQNPLIFITNQNIICGTGTGDFSTTIKSLKPGTTYYVKAYAINSAGTAYGETKQFTTSTLTKDY